MASAECGRCGASELRQPPPNATVKVISSAGTERVRAEFDTELDATRIEDSDSPPTGSFLDVVGGTGANPEVELGDVTNPEFVLGEDDNAVFELGPGGENPEYNFHSIDIELDPSSDESKSTLKTFEEETSPSTKSPKKLLGLLFLVAALEGADMVLLPCVFFALQEDLGLTLNNLALMSMIQGLTGNFSAPIWGVLADRGTLQRRTMIVVGCVLQGLITVALAGVDGLALMIFLRAINGVMLASLKPIAHGIVADVTVDANRGKAFALLQIAMNIGTMIGSLIGTNMARQSILGLQGWRVAFLIIGGAGVLVGALTWMLMEEPRKAKIQTEKGATRWAAFKTELTELSAYFKMPSFCVLILQGCFGTVPWNALGYKVLFFQLGGVSDFQASLIDVFSQVAGSLGNIFGGIIGDGLSRCSPLHGRPLTAQISVLAGIPVAWFIFMESPPEDGAFVYYLLLIIVLGLTATWCGVAVNLPILSQLVREDRRATIMAWEGTLESSCSAIFGNAMVGVLAQNVFGYNLNNAKNSMADGNHDNAKALGTALMLVSFFPWMLCFACYSMLHWSYPRDMVRVKERELSLVAVGKTFSEKVPVFKKEEGKRD